MLQLVPCTVDHVDPSLVKVKIATLPGLSLAVSRSKSLLANFRSVPQTMSATRRI